MRILHLLILILFTKSLLAHGSHGSGIIAGLTHPIFGLDHLLTIFAMGLYCKIEYKEYAWWIIFSFVAIMIIGGLLGIGSEPFPYEELVISSSVLYFGAILGLGIKMNIKLFFSLLFLIALFHGHAHGVEIPATTTPLLYVPGFVLGAIIIAAFGEFVGRHLSKDNMTIAKFLGGFVLGMGLMHVLS